MKRIFFLCVQFIWQEIGGGATLHYMSYLVLWVCITQECFVTSLVNIGPLVQMEKIFFNFVNLFLLFVIISPSTRRRTTDKFWSEKLTWDFGSGELKTFIDRQTDRQTDKQTDRQTERRTEWKQYTPNSVCGGYKNELINYVLCYIYRHATEWFIQIFINELVS